MQEKIEETPSASQNSQNQKVTPKSKKEKTPSTKQKLSLADKIALNQYQSVVAGRQSTSSIQMDRSTPNSKFPQSSSKRPPSLGRQTAGASSSSAMKTPIISAVQANQQRWTLTSTASAQVLSKAAAATAPQQLSQRKPKTTANRGRKGKKRSAEKMEEKNGISGATVDNNDRYANFEENQMIDVRNLQTQNSVDAVEQIGNVLGGTNNGRASSKLSMVNENKQKLINNDDDEFGVGGANRVQGFTPALSDNAAMISPQRQGDLSPQFVNNKRSNNKGGEVVDHDGSISLTQYYLQEASQKRDRSAEHQTEKQEKISHPGNRSRNNEHDNSNTNNDQEQDFLKTLSQMEREDVPVQVIQEYKRAEIIRKSVAVVKEHAQKMEQIRTSPERYSRVQGKVKTYNQQYATHTNMSKTQKSGFNLTNVGSNAILGSSRYHNNDRSLSPYKRSPIREKSERSTSHPNLKQVFTNPSSQNKVVDDDLYRPELGSIPKTTILTRQNRERIEARDRQIADKEVELAQILETIEQRKQEREDNRLEQAAQARRLKEQQQENQFYAQYQDGSGNQEHAYDTGEEKYPRKLTQEIIREAYNADPEMKAKYDAQSLGLNSITMASFTEMKSHKNPPQSVKDTIIFVADLIYGMGHDYQLAKKELICQPVKFLRFVVNIAFNLEPYHFEHLKTIKEKLEDPERVKAVSYAAYGISQWIHALADYSNYTEDLMFGVDGHKVRRAFQKGPMAAQDIIQRRNQKKQAAGWKYSTNASDLDQNGTLLRNANYIQSTKPEHEQIDEEKQELTAQNAENQQIEIDQDVQEMVSNFNQLRKDFTSTKNAGMIQELAAFVKPPACVIDISICLVQLLTLKKEDWGFMKKYYKRQCSQDLNNFDPINRAINISQKEVKVLKKYCKQNLTEQQIMKISLVMTQVYKILEAFIDIVDFYHPNLVRDSQPVADQEQEDQPSRENIEVYSEEIKQEIVEFDDQIQSQIDDRQNEQVDLEYQALISEFESIELKKAEFTELRRFKNPPQVVIDLITGFGQLCLGPKSDYNQVVNQILKRDSYMVKKAIDPVRISRNPKKFERIILRNFKEQDISEHQAAMASRAIMPIRQILDCLLRLVENQGTLMGGVAPPAPAIELPIEQAQNTKKSKKKVNQQKIQQIQSQVEQDDHEEEEGSTTPQHRFYNAELERRTREIQDEFRALELEMAERRDTIDRDAFYIALDELNYGGVNKFTTSPTKRLVKHHEHTVEQKFRFKEEHQEASKIGQQYNAFSKSYIVEPADGKGLNYKLIDKKPLKFYDQVLGQDIIKKKVYKERQRSESPTTTTGMGDNNPLNQSAISRRMHLPDHHLAYREELTKRGVADIAEVCRNQIDQANRSVSPQRLQQQHNQDQGYDHLHQQDQQNFMSSTLPRVLKDQQSQMQYLSVQSGSGVGRIVSGGGDSFMRTHQVGVSGGNQQEIQPENSLLTRLQAERAQKESTRLKRQNKQKNQRNR